MKKIIRVFIVAVLSFSVLLGSIIMPVSAEGTGDLLEINLQDHVLATEFIEENTYFTYESDSSHEIVDIFDVDTGEKLATLELNYANPLSRAESTGAYRKYLSNGLTIVHSFAFSYTTSGTSKIVSSVLWQRVSVDGWSFFSLDDYASNASKSGSNTISGNYSATIKATISGELKVSAEYKKALTDLGFGGSITVGSSYFGTKTFTGSWTLSVNQNPGCTTTMCPTSAN